MKLRNQTLIMGLVCLLAGIGIGQVLLSGNLHIRSGESGKTDESIEKKEPLYWVAPMDPNYKRDKPGKSPMGMDLIPVYEESAGDSTAVTISPAVVNNIGVKVGKAEYRDIRPVIRTVGYVSYNEDRLIHIHPRVEGWIEKLHVTTSGDRVEQGMPLYELYSPQLVNAQEEYLSALARGNASLVKAAEGRLEALQLSAEFIRKLKRSRRVSQTVIFESPQAGVVDNLNIREGFFVKPGTTLMSIGALDDVWVEAEVFERQVSLVHKGLAVEMFLDFLPGKSWQGQVEYVYPTLDPVTRTARVRLRFDNPGELLKPNMFAQIRIFAEGRRALTVPRHAVIRLGDENRVVLALGDGRFKSVRVTVSEMDDDYAVIEQGLEPGDAVVTSAQFLIDSESSKTSDFMRMTESSDGMSDKRHEVGNGESGEETAWVRAEVLSVDTKKHQVRLAHEAIEVWQWPAMTMNFAVADSVDMAALHPGQVLHAHIKRSDEGNRLIGIHILSQDDTSKETRKTIETAETTGMVRALDARKRMATIDRDAIQKWNRPPATVDFVVADHLDLGAFEVGKPVAFRFEIQGDDFVIVELLSQHPAGAHQ